MTLNHVMGSMLKSFSWVSKWVGRLIHLIFAADSNITVFYSYIRISSRSICSLVYIAITNPNPGSFRRKALTRAPTLISFFFLGIFFRY